MPFNQLKRYSDFLEITHFFPHERTISLRAIFDRDITDNTNFSYKTKIIRPIKKEGVLDMDTLFKHLTYMTVDDIDEKGKKYKSRSEFDINRSKRLHWIWYHIQEKKIENLMVFSHKDRKDGKWVTRTYIYDFVQEYVVILEPQRSGLDYYLLSAYHLTNAKGGLDQIQKKIKRKLDEVY